MSKVRDQYATTVNDSETIIGALYNILFKLTNDICVRFVKVLFMRRCGLTIVSSTVNGDRSDGGVRLDLMKNNREFIFEVRLRT